MRAAVPPRCPTAATPPHHLLHAADSTIPPNIRQATICSHGWWRAKPRGSFQVAPAPPHLPAHTHRNPPCRQTDNRTLGQTARGCATPHRVLWLPENLAHKMLRPSLRVRCVYPNLLPAHPLGGQTTRFLSGLGCRAQNHSRHRPIPVSMHASVAVYPLQTAVCAIAANASESPWPQTDASAQYRQTRPRPANAAPPAGNAEPNPALPAGCG